MAHLFVEQSHLRHSAHRATAPSEAPLPGQRPKLARAFFQPQMNFIAGTWLANHHHQLLHGNALRQVSQANPAAGTIKAPPRSAPKLPVGSQRLAGKGPGKQGYHNTLASPHRQAAEHATSSNSNNNSNYNFNSSNCNCNSKGASNSAAAATARTTLLNRLTHQRDQVSGCHWPIPMAARHCFMSQAIIATGENIFEMSKSVCWKRAYQIGLRPL